MTKDKIIKLDGDSWRVLSTGVIKNGQTYCHLASVTRFKKQKNGDYPIQSCQFVDNKILGIN